MSRLRAAAIVAAVMAAACIAFACNGDSAGSMTLEEYFTELERLEADSEQRGEELDDPFELDENTPQDERREAFVKLKDGANDIFEDYLDAYADFEPPDEAAELHDAYGDAIEEFVDTYNALLDVYAEAESLEDIVADESSEFFAALEEVIGACQALEDRAAEHDINVDLRCEDD